MSSAAAPRRLGFGFWSFVVLMLALAGLFAALGIWQVNRLAWKDGLIAEVAERLTQPPDALPPVADWSTADLTTLGFHPVTVTGQYLPGKTVRVFTSLSDAKGKYDGPGFWVMSAFAPDSGGTLFVNRGFVPQAEADRFKSGGDVPVGPQTVIGIAVAPEASGMFTPPPDAANAVEWVRDPVRLAKLAGIEGPVLGLTIDAPAVAPGALPQGGETLVDFPNNHLGYALTWFGFALLTPGLLAAWAWRQVRPKPQSP